MDTALHRALHAFAARPRVLIGVDFDGTLAPLVDEPMSARALPGALDLLAELASLPGVSVAVVSGRDLASLDLLTQLVGSVVLVGSHGAESSRTGGAELDEVTGRRFAALDGDLQGMLADHPGVRLERKPTALVLHTRGLPPERASAAREAGEDLAERHTDVQVTQGKDVLEMAVTEAGKGPALLALAESERADAVLYLGDDVTDELAFEVLREQDVSVRVGDGETAADHRVADEAAVVELLRDVLAARRDSQTA